MLQAVFSLLFSTYNLAGLRNCLGVAPLAVNMLCDILVAAFMISYGAIGLDHISYGRLIPAKILAGIALAIGIICGWVVPVLSTGLTAWSSGRFPQYHNETDLTIVLPILVCLRFVVVRHTARSCGNDPGALLMGN